MDFETGDSAAALVAEVRLAADFLVPFAEGFLDPASCDRSGSGPVVRFLRHCAAVARVDRLGYRGDSSALRAKRCRP